MKVRIERTQAVWETATFTVEVPKALSGDMDAIREWVEDNIADLIGSADVTLAIIDNVVPINGEISIELTE